LPHALNTLPTTHNTSCHRTACWNCNIVFLLSSRMQQILTVWTATWDPGESSERDIHGLMRFWTKGDGGINVGLQDDLYIIVELLFRIYVIFVIVYFKLLSSTSQFVFFFILKILKKTFYSWLGSKPCYVGSKK
jgi:hypothetical protein